MGRAMPAAVLEQVFRVSYKHSAHEVDRKNDDGHTDEIRFQLFCAVDLEPSGELELLDKELVEANGRDIEYRAHQEYVHELYHLKDDRASIHLAAGMCKAIQCGNNDFYQLPEQTNAAKNEKD